MLVISTQNWSILAKFAKNIQRNRLLLTVSWRSFPQKFPVKSADFSKNSPQKSFEIWLFPLKSREIGQFFCKFWLFSRENHVKWADFWANFDFFPAKSADFSTNLPLKIPRNFAFFPRNIRSPDFYKNIQCHTVLQVFSLTWVVLNSRLRQLEWLTKFDPVFIIIIIITDKKRSTS